MVHALSFKSGTGILRHSAGPPFLLFLPHFQSFRSPDSMHSFETHFEPFQSQQTRHPPVTEAGALPSQFMQSLANLLGITLRPPLVANTIAGESDSATGPTLRNRKLASQTFYCLLFLGRAQSFPRSASLSIALSSSASASSRLRRAYSPSSSFSRLASSLFKATISVTGG